MLFWTLHFSVLESTFWLDCTLKTDHAATAWSYASAEYDYYYNQNKILLDILRTQRFIKYCTEIGLLITD